MDISLIISAGLAFLGNSLIAVGQGTQKSQVSGIQLDEDRRQKFKRLLLWGLGIASSNVGLVLIYKAIDLGHTTVVGTLSGSGLITLVLFSHFVLKEKISRRELVGIILIFLGVLTMPLWPGDSHPSYVQNDRLFLTVAGGIALFLILIIVILKRQSKKVGPVLALLAGSMTGFSQIYQKVSTRSEVALLRQPSFYIFLAFFLLSFSAMQMAYRRHKAITVIPYFNAMAVMIPLVGGQVFFGEVLSVPQWISVLVILTGMFLVDISFLTIRHEAPPARGA